MGSIVRQSFVYPCPISCLDIQWFLYIQSSDGNKLRNKMTWKNQLSLGFHQVSSSYYVGATGIIVVFQIFRNSKEQNKPWKPCGCMYFFVGEVHTCEFSLNHSSFKHSHLSTILNWIFDLLQWTSEHHKYMTVEPKIFLFITIK